MDREKMVTDVLRLRGGGDTNPDRGMDTSGAMATGESSSAKRGPPSPLGATTAKKKTVPTTSSKGALRTLNEHIGWIEQTVIQERAKKLTVAAAEGFLEHATAIRNIYSDLCVENSRLQGITQFSASEMSGYLTNFTNSLSAKNAEIETLKRENKELRDKLENSKNSMDCVYTPTPQVVTEKKTESYAQKAKAKAKSNKNSTKDMLTKCRKAKSGTRFVTEVPEGGSLADIKSNLWSTVKNKIRNPRAKTMIQGNKMIIIPDDNNTFEMLKEVPNLKAVGPRVPRIVIYDVDSDISEGEIAEGLLLQNPELGLVQEDIDAMCVRHKLGPKGGNTTHWVIETPASILPKLENKSVFLGMTRCRVKIYKGTVQCYNCQRFGHTAPRCEQPKPACRYCAGEHDSRECTNKGNIKCANCNKDHMSTSSSCQARSRAVQTLLRRTDFIGNQ